MRSYDITRIAEAYSRGLPNLFSLECWGGATFDVAMRFLNEDPWERLAAVREGAPNILTQMLLRGSNGVGYTNYPDNVVKFFVRQAAKGGVDVFRIFDCLNWVENMRVSIDAVVEAGKVAEGAICYTGDLLDPDRAKYDLKYYVALAKELEAAGAHVLGLKDMAGLLKPAAAKKLIATLKQEIGLPIHLHTHDTSGAAAATIMAAVEAGVDAVDAAMDAFSGTTSQPTLRLARGGAARHRPRSRARRQGDPRNLVLLGGGAHAVPRLRERPQGRRLGSLSARNARRAVHQSQGAGALARARERAGTRSRRPMPTSTRCSAISSR